MSDYDLRQYNLMLDLLNNNITSMDNLGSVLNKLQALVSALEKKDENWLSNFMSHWWILDEIFAYYDSQGVQTLDTDISEKVDKSRQELRQLVASKVQDSRNS